jgi:hypothetical protein
MKSHLEISQILNVLMRFSMSQEGLDASSAELKECDFAHFLQHAFKRSH